MIPRLKHRVMQTQIHDPEQGVTGNCMAAAFASVSGESIEVWNHLTGDDDWYRKMEAMWAERGYGVVRLSASYFEGAAPAGVCLVSGKSPRDVSHMVIFEDGRLVHDPHPSQGGIHAPEVWWMLWPLVKAA